MTNETEVRIDLAHASMFAAIVFLIALIGGVYMGREANKDRLKFICDSGIPFENRGELYTCKRINKKQ